MSLTSHWLTSLPPFLNKNKKIRDTFLPSGTESDVHPPSDPQKIIAFDQVSEEQNPECWDPWPIFLTREVSDILLPLLTKLVNCSIMKGCVPCGFKSASVTSLIKKLLFQWMT